MFGDPLPGLTKYCFCDELTNEIHPVAEFCAVEGETCECEAGNNIAYGKVHIEENKTIIDFTF